MTPFRTATFLVLAGLLTSGTTLFAQEPAATDPAGDEPQEYSSAPTAVTPAASVPFRNQLGLPYPTLGTLGGRIDAARRAGDPVAMAHAASELDVAEKVSGKTASLTSKQVLAEAAELASVRKRTADTSAVLKVSESLAVAEENLADMKKQLAFSQNMAAQDEKSLAEKLEPTSAPRKILVNNYSTQYIEIQVNGFIRGQVLPGASRTFTIDQRWNPIVIKGWGDEDATTYGPIRLRGQFKTYTWNINGGTGVPTPFMP